MRCVKATKVVHVYPAAFRIDPRQVLLSNSHSRTILDVLAVQPVEKRVIREVLPDVPERTRNHTLRMLESAGLIRIQGRGSNARVSLVNPQAAASP